MPTGNICALDRLQYEERHLNLLKLVNEMTSVQMPSEGIEGCPKIQLAELKSEQELDKFFEAMNWSQAQIVVVSIVSS